MVLSGDPAVDKKVVFMEQDSGHGPEKGQFFRKQRLNGLPGGGKCLGIGDIHPGLVGHGNPGALLPPKVSILGSGLVGPGPVEKVQGDIFTVALEEEEGMGPAQVHEIPQGVQAAGGFLQNIPQDQQNVVGGKLDLFQQALEKGKIAVNVADDQHPPVRRQGEGTHNRSHGVIAPGLPGQSSRSFPGGLSPAAPPAPGRQPPRLPGCR